MQTLNICLCIKAPHFPLPNTFSKESQTKILNGTVLNPNVNVRVPAGRYKSLVDLCTLVDKKT